MRTSKPCNVVMLPTEKESNLMLSLTDRSFTHGGIRILKNTLSIGAKEARREYWERQHLYITSNEEIKKGDLIIHGNVVVEVKRITPDGYLVENPITDFVLKPSILHKKIIASTNKSLTPNSWIDTPFVLAYIKAYNEGNPITEVQVEYEVEGFTTSIFGSTSEDTIKYKPKTRPDNSIIIHQSKLYTRDEVIDKVWNLLERYPEYRCMQLTKFEIDKWIEENL